ncbi:MAG TPA: DUF2269 family protein [Rhodocyclaceae bacterium]|nr:DUF2269 family protein [Rhodocyclaceae bacterium]
MSTYLLVEYAHVFSSVVLVGTGFGSAFYLFCANRFGSTTDKLFIGRLVVIADWIFTTPAVIVQPLTGLWLMHAAGWHVTTPWILAGLSLYIFVGLCWLPVVVLQIRMQRMARDALAAQRALPAAYASTAAWWEGLGYLGFGGSIAIFWVMVAKPSFVEGANMTILSRQIEIDASQTEVFRVSQDDRARLIWDCFTAAIEYSAALREAGTRARVLARNGFRMDVRFIKCQAPLRAAVVMTRGPWLFRRFAGTWEFREMASARCLVKFRYQLELLPVLRWTGFECLVARFFARDIRLRLEGLKRYCKMNATYGGK